MKQFDVYLVTFDPTVGAEIKKTRPAVIVSPDGMNRNLQTVIVAPLTHTGKGYPSRIGTNFGGKSGEAALDQMRAVDKHRLVKKQGTMDATASADIKAALQTMFT